MTKSKNFWNQLTSTLWFIPTLFAMCGATLGLLMVGFDYYVGSKLGYHPRFFDVQPSGARDMLSVVAGSMITVAGTVFSITIVALTLASTQFSPRILRNFMRDMGNQVVLGAFVGIFAYCIIVLRTIRENGDDNSSFVPSISVAVGVFLGLSGIGFLIYYIHHVSVSIQATSIISNIAKETITEIERNYFFEYDTKQYDTKTIEKLSDMQWLEIPSEQIGYIQNADTDALTEIAKRRNFVIRMRRRVGEFTVKTFPLLEVLPQDKDFKIDENLIKELNKVYDIGNFRTVEGDVAFGIRQIVDIALKALSPAVNDTTTGLSCIDYLTAVMVYLAKRPSRPPLYFDNGILRLVINQQRFEDYFDLAFNQIRQNAAGNVAIIIRLITAVEVLGKINQTFIDEDTGERNERHEIFETKIRLLHELAEKTIPADADLLAVTHRYESAKAVLEDLR